MANTDSKLPIYKASLSQHPLSAPLETWLETLRADFPQLTWMIERSQGNQPPELTLSSRLTYQAIPEGPELPLFHQALALQEISRCPFDTALQDRIQGLQIPHKLVLFMANQCHYCPQVVLQLLHYIRLTSQATLKVIDAQLLPELADTHSVKAVPTLILDDRMRWSGQMDIGEVVAFVENQDPAVLSTDTLAAMVENGQAAQLAEMMLTHGQVFEAFDALLTDEKWAIRLGAMVVMETLIELDSALAANYLHKFWNDWSGLDGNVKGDLLYLMGETQAPFFRKPILDLMASLSEAESAIRTAAQDALDNLPPES